VPQASCWNSYEHGRVDWVAEWVRGVTGSYTKACIVETRRR